MGVDEAFRQIDDLRKRIPRPNGMDVDRLPIEEVRRLADELPVLPPEHRRWILPQLMLDLLTSTEHPDYIYRLHQFMRDLNVPAGGPDPAYYAEAAERWGEERAESQRELHQRLAAREEREYRQLTREEAMAIIAFLNAIRDRIGHESALKDWDGALSYWTARAATSGRGDAP